MPIVNFKNLHKYDKLVNCNDKYGFFNNTKGTCWMISIFMIILMSNEIEKTSVEIEQENDKNNSVFSLMRIKNANGEILRPATKKEKLDYEIKLINKSALEKRQKSKDPEVIAKRAQVEADKAEAERLKNLKNATGKPDDGDEADEADFEQYKHLYGMSKRKPKDVINTAPALTEPSDPLKETTESSTVIEKKAFFEAQSKKPIYQVNDKVLLHAPDNAIDTKPYEGIITKVLENEKYKVEYSDRLIKDRKHTVIALTVSAEKDYYITKKISSGGRRTRKCKRRILNLRKTQKHRISKRRTKKRKSNNRKRHFRNSTKRIKKY